MKRAGLGSWSGAAIAACAGLLATTVPATAAVSDKDFNEYVAQMAGTDTASAWFDNYVAALNQEIDLKQGTGEFGAAGPTGPLSGFDAYLSGFVGQDSGSRLFDTYVDYVNRVIREKQR